MSDAKVRKMASRPVKLKLILNDIAVYSKIMVLLFMKERQKLKIFRKYKRPAARTQLRIRVSKRALIACVGKIQTEKQLLKK